MSNTTKNPSSLRGWLLAGGIGVAALAGMIALVLAWWVILGSVVAFLAWVAFALSAPALGVTFLNLVIPGAIVVAIASFLAGGRK